MATPEVKVSRTIDAPVQDLWERISDVTRMGELSPETTSCTRIEGATGVADRSEHNRASMEKTLEAPAASV